MKEKLKHWGKEILSLSLMLFIMANAISYFRAPDIKDENLPQLSTLLTNGELFSTTDYQNKPVLIHFWATWCPTCKLEAANIQSISENFNVITIAVKSGSDAKINSFLKDNDLNFKVINDAEGILSQGFDVQAYPTSFIYSKDNILKFSEVGYTSTLGLYLRMWWAGL
ncbi:MAG: protein disulfide oxidoreductase [Arcobacter sp.]|nr:MAG: protein disulfide oxidoreductase [Arcobacter sp.]